MKNILPHVDAASLVAPDAITQPQGHRIDYNCSFCKFNKKNANNIRQKSNRYENFATHEGNWA